MIRPLARTQFWHHQNKRHQFHNLFLKFRRIHMGKNPGIRRPSGDLALLYLEFIQVGIKLLIPTIHCMHFCSSLLLFAYNSYSLSALYWLILIKIINSLVTCEQFLNPN